MEYLVKEKVTIRAHAIALTFVDIDLNRGNPPLQTPERIFHRHMTKPALG